MGSSQTISHEADLRAAKDLLNEEIARRLVHRKPEDSKFLQYAGLALYIEAELGAIGIDVTLSTIKALEQADYDAMMARDAYEDSRYLFGDTEVSHTAPDAALEKLDRNWQKVGEAKQYFQNKNIHSPQSWVSDVIKTGGDARLVVVEEICRHATEFSDSALLAIEIIKGELGDSASVIVEVLKEAIMYIDDMFYRAIDGRTTDAYIHPQNPKQRLKYCAKNRIIPESMIKKMLAHEALADWM